MQDVTEANEKLIIINTKQDTRWDEFVASHPQGSIYHHSAWGKVLQLTYGYNPIYIALQSGTSDRLKGIAPFMSVNSWLTGKRIVSLPFSTYCNPIIPNEQISNLVHFVRMFQINNQYLQIKCLEYNESNSLDILDKQSRYVTHILNIDVPLEQLFKSFHNTSVRQRIKRADRLNLKLRMADKEEDIKKFYELETIVRKKHGLPPQPYRFFSNMWQILMPQDLLIVPMIEYKGEIIAAAMVLKFKDTFYFEYSASDQGYLKFGPNPKLIWETIKMASLAGAKYLDFGRSSLANSSLVEFKERWGAKRYNLGYYYFPEAKTTDFEKSFRRRSLEMVNRHLPSILLKFQGKMLYSHLG